MELQVLNDIKLYIERILKNNPNRLQHILSVRDKALELAKIYHVDLIKVEIAALLHDATKHLPMEKTIEWAKHMMSEENIETIPKGCLHAYSAAYLARHKFHIADDDILHAIMYHCSGRLAMSKLEQVIYVSDFIEDLRTFVDPELRSLALIDLDLTTYKIIKRTIEYLESKDQYVSNLTYDALTYYQKKRRK